MGLVLTATTPAGTKACKLEVVVGLRKAGSTREIACQTYAVELDKRAAGKVGTEWRGSVRNLFPKPGDDKYGIGLDEGKYELTVRVRRTGVPEVAVKAMPVTVQSPYGH
jgi:hypothetical protein